MTPPWYVLTGGPCSGKTTLINELKGRSYSVFPESARTVIAAQLATGKNIEAIVADPLALEKLIVAHQQELVAEAPKDQIVFFDRGIPDNVAYLRKFGIPVEEFFTNAIQSVTYRKVFLLDMIEFANDAERYETPQEAAWLHTEITRAYEELGYEIVQVPIIPVSERADFVLARL
ncbi:MAG: ATP-binding protein [Candidatus Pacebacteria bacterium]|nr:ATP-binding protein [Candidatus Paceibacterota bacterium]